DSQFASCAQKVADLGEAAMPCLLDGLRDPDPSVCGKMQYPLLLMSKKWGHDDERTMMLVEQLHRKFDRFSSAGQEKAVLLVTSLLQTEGPRPLPPRLTKAVGNLLTAADKQAELRPAALLLAAELVDCVQPGQWVDVGRTMAERGLDDERPACKV